jgi:hypothetical protein
MRAGETLMEAMGFATRYPVGYTAATGKQSPVPTAIGYARAREYIRGYLKSGPRTRKAHIEGPAAEEA